MDGTAPQPSYAELAALVTELRGEIVRLKTRIEELEKKNPTQRLGQSYSVKADEKRRRDADEKKSGKPKTHGSGKDQQASERRGRVPNQDKIDKADHHELVLPDGFDLPQCHPGIERPVWRIRNGKATLIVYEIWRGPNGEEGQIDGVLPLSEFGFEIHVTVAFMVSMVGLSMDKVCTLLKFFWELELSKSQADALLNQLSRQWEHEFESLCQLLAVSAVVHADETSWSLNSVWAFLSEKARVLVFGCRKDGETLAQILPKDSFAEIGRASCRERVCLAV